MEVYIEYVIIDTFIINWLLLWSAVKTMGLKFNWFLCLISSLFGTIVSCLVPLINFSGIALFIIKLILGLLMVLMCYKYKSFKQFIYTFMIFVSYTFLMGGACYAVIILLGGTFENITIGKYDAIVPVSIVIATCFVYAFIIFRLVKYIYRKKDMIPFMQTAIIEVDDKEYSFTAFMDSGNRLYDKKTGAPVIIVSAFALEKYFSEDDIAKLIFGEKNSKFKNVHYLNYGTVDGHAKKMVVFESRRVKIQNGDNINTFENIVIGVTFRKFKDAINYEMLLHPQLM